MTYKVKKWKKNLWCRLHREVLMTVKCLQLFKRSGFIIRAVLNKLLQNMRKMHKVKKKKKSRVLLFHSPNYNTVWLFAKCILENLFQVENLLVCFTSEYIEFMLIKFSGGCNVKKEKIILEMLFSVPLLNIFTDNSVYHFFS